MIEIHDVERRLPNGEWQDTALRIEPENTGQLMARLATIAFERDGTFRAVKCVTRDVVMYTQRLRNGGVLMTMREELLRDE